jgi:hypothetical protein
VGMFIFMVSDIWSSVQKKYDSFSSKLAAFALASAITFSAKLLRAGTLSKLVYVDHIYLFCGVSYSNFTVVSSRLTSQQLWNGSAALCDIAIAGCMTFFVRNLISQSEAHRLTRYDSYYAVLASKIHTS